jgi:hypothetical protein
LVCITLAAFMLGSTPAFVPGEWLVTFSESSSSRRSLERAAPDEYAARLAEVAARLSEAVGIPLRAGPAAGGGTWVVRVDAERTLASVEKRLADGGASPVRSVPVEPGGVWEIPHDRELRVDLERGTDRSDLERSLKASAVPVSIDEREGGLAVRVDWRALTEIVSERLTSQPDVVSVELNEVAVPSEDESRGGCH